MITTLSLTLIPVYALHDFNVNTPADMKAPKLIVPDDIYIKSNHDTRVSFIAKAIDNVDGIIQIDCTKPSNAVFNVGRTKVHCSASDSAGNISTANFTVTVGYEIVKIPRWIKQVTEFWVNEQIDDETYMQTLGYLIKNEYLSIPYSKSPNELTEYGFPNWIKNNGKLWSTEKISDDEFSIGLQWLINRGFIK